MQQTNFVATITEKPKNDSRSGVQVLTQTNRYLFYLFIIGLSVPFFEIPYISLSITAPLMGLLALDTLFNQRVHLRFSNFSWVIAIIYLLGIGMFCSIALNDFSQGVGDPRITSSDILLLGYQFYWLTMLVVCLVVLSTDDQVYKYAPLAAAAGIIILTLARVFEGFVFNSWGSRNPVFTSQNNYGMLFSAFMPFLVGLYFFLDRKWYPAITLLLAIALFAVVGNVSRGSWFGVTAGLSVILVSVMFSSPSRGIQALSFVVVAILLVVPLSQILPASLTQPVTQRFQTLESLEDDKEWQIRVIMIQKGLLHFQNQPFTGVGLGRFNDSLVEIELPRVLSYRGYVYFNRKDTHNSYVKLLSETGILGVVPYVMLMGTIIVLAIPTYLYALREKRWEFIVLLASFVGLSVHFWVLSGLQNSLPWFIYAYMLATIYRLYMRRNAVSRNVETEPIQYEIDRLVRL